MEKESYSTIEYALAPIPKPKKLTGFAATDIARQFKHPDREAILKYVELLCNKSSELNTIENLEERKKAALTKSKWMGTEDKKVLEQVNELIFHYLSYFQGYNDFALLLSREELYSQMLQAMREPLVNTADEDKYLKNIKIKGDINNLLGQLLIDIKSQRVSIYGVHEEIAVSRIKKVLTPESRLKSNGDTKTATI